MAVTDTLRTFAREYMKVDEDECADDVLDVFLESAIGYLETAGVSHTYGVNDNRYQLAVSAVALNYYDHRDMTVSTAQWDPSFGIGHLITQMKLAQEATLYVSNPDT